ncbi:unnamed protein product [Soboliphyme baturini]|uniref:NOT2_3_5 domain-containing protein n=1 Tax=Soboliphyme baturini TaxID=241478 RepID=A0A183IFM5_9BILA|nr:unnamed protein product [Soboliphyme baturini]
MMSFGARRRAFVGVEDVLFLEKFMFFNYYFAFDDAARAVAEQDLRDSRWNYMPRYKIWYREVRNRSRAENSASNNRVRYIYWDAVDWVAKPFSPSPVS